jgi:hypothetical protein
MPVPSRPLGGEIIHTCSCKTRASRPERPQISLTLAKNARLPKTGEGMGGPTAIFHPPGRLAHADLT